MHVIDSRGETARSRTLDERRVEIGSAVRMSKRSVRNRLLTRTLLIVKVDSVMVISGQNTARKVVHGH